LQKKTKKCQKITGKKQAKKNKLLNIGNAKTKKRISPKKTARKKSDCKNK